MYEGPNEAPTSVSIPIPCLLGGSFIYQDGSLLLNFVQLSFNSNALLRVKIILGLLNFFMEILNSLVALQLNFSHTVSTFFNSTKFIKFPMNNSILFKWNIPSDFGGLTSVDDNNNVITLHKNYKTIILSL